MTMERVTVRWAIRRSRSGFTLLELLVAVTVFAVMAGVAYLGLDAAVASEETLARRGARSNDAALFLGRLEREMGSLARRPWRDATGIVQAPFFGETVANGKKSNLTFTRFDWNEGGEPGVVKSGYRLRDGTLEALFWPRLDEMAGDEPEAYPVMENVIYFQMLFKASAEGEWLERWDNPNPPKAMMLTLALGDREAVTRTFALR